MIHQKDAEERSLIPRRVLTLDSRVAFREVSTGRYFHRYCVEDIEGKAMPASLREVGWRDPGCQSCGESILGQVQLGVYRTLLVEEGTTVKQERLKRCETWVDELIKEWNKQS